MRIPEKNGQLLNCGTAEAEQPNTKPPADVFFRARTLQFLDCLPVIFATASELKKANPLLEGGVCRLVRWLDEITVTLVAPRKTMDNRRRYCPMIGRQFIGIISRLM